MNEYNPIYMKLAIKEAEKSRGFCSPNPFVGAVIVKDDQVITKGSTQAYGHDHAEIQAIKAAGDLCKGAQMYVTLEPCAHYGKTPPCAEAIVRAGITDVYIGIIDPNPLVSCKGIKIMKEHGVRVSYGYFEDLVKIQNEYFLSRIEKGRPFVLWKSALSLDGKYAAEDGSSRWITDSNARNHVHRIRQTIDVILTGINTVIYDDPLLNVRLSKPKRHPHRVILDPLLQIPLDSAICTSVKQYPSTIFYDKNLEQTSKQEILIEMGFTLYPVSGVADKLDLTEVLHILHTRGFYSVLLECGSKLASSFFEADLVDKCLIYYGSKLLGGSRGILSELPIQSIDMAILCENLNIKKIGKGFIVTAYPKRG